MFKIFNTFRIVRISCTVLARIPTIHDVSVVDKWVVGRTPPGGSKQFQIKVINELGNVEKASVGAAAKMDNKFRLPQKFSSRTH